MHEFSYHRPQSLEETFELLGRYGEDARLIAGGTALVILMKDHRVKYDHLISLASVPGLGAIATHDNALHVGATVTQRAMEISPEVRAGRPLLAETYHHVGTVRIRNSATVGGGLAHGDPNQDPPPSLIALGATVGIESREGRRDLPVEELYQDYYETALQPGEIIREVVVPPLPPGSVTAFIKFLPRTAYNSATVSAAANIQVRNGHCQDARIGIGSAGPVPIRARRVEDALRGQPLSPAVLRDAADLAREEVDPLDDIRGSASYKRDMAAVITRRTIEKALQSMRSR